MFLENAYRRREKETACTKAACSNWKRLQARDNGASICVAMIDGILLDHDWRGLLRDHCDRRYQK